MEKARNAAIAALTALALTGCGVAKDYEATGEQNQALVTASFQNGVSPSAAYAGTDDTMLKQGSATSNFGTATSCEVDGDDGSGVDKSCLIKWSLSGIPAGSAVQTATIDLRITDRSNNTYNLYAMNRAWNEAEATWQNATSSVTWETAGALGATDRGAVIGSVTGATGNRTITLNAAGVAAVQSWVNGGTNAGIIIASTSNTDGIDFASSEHGTASYHPKLTITYEPPTGTGGTGGAAGSGGTGGTGGTTGGTGGTGGSGGNGTISTDPGLKIGFVGDTSTGTTFRNVLTLVKNESAAALVVEGDMSYSANPTAWWSDVDAVLGTSFPVFISRGNHDDSSWSGYLPSAATHLGGATRTAGAHDANYKTTFRGLVIATIKKGDNPATHINPLLQGDDHIWKVCNWHQNQAAMQIGGKGDEMGWPVYEACRQQGAIVETGHEHSYERTKTLTNITSQIVDPTCTTAGSLCVGAGRTFVNVVGLGGNSVRDQTRCLPATAPYGCNGEWAFIYTSNQSATYGAQFITFNDGDARRATGYFKNINGQTVDTFTITHD